MAFKRIGSDRLNMGIAGAVNSPTGTLFTGDITKGDVVVVEFDAAATASETVKARRTGAILIGASFSGNGEYRWEISDTTLTVTANGALTGAFTFWVF